MKRNLLIGTSLVAAFSTVSAKAPSNEEMRISGAVSDAYVIATKALAPEFDTKAVALKAETGSTLLVATLNSEAGREAVAKILKATTAETKTVDALSATFGKQTEAQKKATVAEIAKALATNAELRKLVAEFRPAVVKEQDKPVNPAPKPEPAPTPEPAPAPTTDAEAVTFGQLSQDVSDTTDALKIALIAEYNAKTAVEKAAADVKTATTNKEAAEKALTDAQKAAQEAAEQAAAAKTAAEQAKAALTALKADHKAQADAITAADKAIKDKTSKGTSVTQAEIDALNVFIAELGTIDAKILAATTAQTETADALTDADKRAADAKTALETATKKRDEAAKELENAVKNETEAKEALTAKAAAVKEATDKLTTAKTAVKAAAEKAATEAAAKAKAATEARDQANLKKAELATAAQKAQAKLVELTDREASLKAEMDAAKAAEKANSTDATKAKVKEKVDAVAAIAREILDARTEAEQANENAAKAVEAAETAATEAATAAEAKTTADAELKAADEAVKAADKAVKAQRATIAELAKTAEATATAARAAAAAQAAQTAADQIASERAAAERRVADLEAAIATAAGVNSNDPALVTLRADLATAKQAVTALVTKDEKAKQDLKNAQLALTNANDLVAQSQAALATAKEAEARAVENARTLSAKLTAAEEAKKAAEKKAADLETEKAKFLSQISDLGAKVTAAEAATDADKVLAKIIADAEAKASGSEDLDAAVATTILKPAKQLQGLMTMKFAGVEGKPSAVLADSLNAEVATKKADFLRDLNSWDSARVAINEYVERFKDFLAEKTSWFGQLKDLVDLDVTTAEAKAAAAADTKVAKRNELIAELQAIYTPANLETVKEAGKLVDFMNFYLERGITRTVLNHFPEVANRELRKLGEALGRASREVQSLGSSILAAHKAMSEESSSSGFGLRSEYEHESKVQNLTAKTFAHLKAALVEYTKFLTISIDAIDTTADIDFVSDNKDLMNRLFGEFEADSSVYAEGSAAKGLAAFKEATKLKLVNVQEDLEKVYKIFDEKQAELRDLTQKMNDAERAKRALDQKVAEQEGDFAKLDADQKTLMAKMVAADYEGTSVEEKAADNAEELRLKGLIDPIKANIEAAQVAEGNLVELRAKFESLNKKLELIRGAWNKLEALIVGVNEARALKVEALNKQNDALTAEIEKAVNVILSPAPKLPTPPASEHGDEEEDEEGSEGSSHEEGEEGAEGARGGDSRVEGAEGARGGDSRVEGAEGARGGDSRVEGALGSAFASPKIREKRLHAESGSDFDDEDGLGSRGVAPYAAQGKFVPHAGGGSLLHPSTAASVGYGHHVTRPSVDAAEGLGIPASTLRAGMFGAPYRSPALEPVAPTATRTKTSVAFGGHSSTPISASEGVTARRAPAPTAPKAKTPAAAAATTRRAPEPASGDAADADAAALLARMDAGMDAMDKI